MEKNKEITRSKKKIDGHELSLSTYYVLGTVRAPSHYCTQLSVVGLSPQYADKRMIERDYLTSSN